MFLNIYAIICVIFQNGCGLFSMLPDPKNKKTSNISTTISMVPRATMNKMSNTKIDSKPKAVVNVSVESKPIEVEEDLDEDEEDGDFLGLNKINDIPDVEPVAGYELPEENTNIPVVEDDKIYGPVYCPEDGGSDIYEDDETRLTLDSNAVRYLFYMHTTNVNELLIFKYYFFFVNFFS